MRAGRWRALFALGTMALLAACGAGSGEGLESTPNCTAGVLEPSWGCIQDFVFTPHCARCHTGAFVGLDEANSPAIVGRPSQEKPELKLIEPGDPDASYLIWKIEGMGPMGEPIVGVRMPFDGPPYLDASTIQIMRNWVTLGAPVP